MFTAAIYKIAKQEDRKFVYYTAVGSRGEEKAVAETLRELEK